MRSSWHPGERHAVSGGDNARTDTRSAEPPVRRDPACDDDPVSDDQPGWNRPEPGAGGPPAEPVPPGWAPVQPPAYPPRPAYSPPAPGSGWGPAPGSGWGPAPGWGAGGFPPPPPAHPKPGVIPLRPLGVGEILDGAISTMRAHPRIMLGLSAVVAVVTQVLTVPVTWLLLHDSADVAFSLDRPATPDEEVSFAASAFTATGVQIVVTLVAALVLTGILTVVVSKAVLGQGISTADAWARARPRVPALLGVTVLVIAIMLGLAALALAPGILLAVSNAPTAATVIAFVAGVPAFLVAAVYLYTAFALAPPAIVLEKQRVVASLRRSRALVRGGWWRTFGMLLLVNVIAQVLAGIISVPFTVLTMLVAFLGGGDGLNVYEIVPLLITSVGTIIASAITWPFTAVSTALIYVDRRMRREALDIELARAAGVAPAGQPVPHR